MKQGDSRKHAIIYTRVSTDQQAESGLGLEAQEAACIDYCERRGWTWAVKSDPGCSGKQINPALRESLSMLTAGRANVLVVAKMDRLARSLKDAVDIMDRAVRQGWSLVAVDLGIDLTTPAGEALASTLASFARFERRIISARISEAMAAKRARGESLGRPSAIPAVVLNRICRERDSGVSFAAIARGLTDDDVLTPGGQAEWQPSTVRRAYNSAKAKTERAEAVAS